MRITDRQKDYESQLAYVQKLQEELVTISRTAFWVDMHDRKKTLEREITTLRRLNGRLPKESRHNVMEDLGFDH